MSSGIDKGHINSGLLLSPNENATNLWKDFQDGQSRTVQGSNWIDLTLLGERERRLTYEE